MPLFAVLRHTAACDESESSVIDPGTKVPDCRFLLLGNIQSCVCGGGGLCFFMHFCADSDFSKEHSGFDDSSLSNAPLSGSPSISVTLNPGGFKDNPKQVLLEGSASPSSSPIGYRATAVLSHLR